MQYVALKQKEMNAMMGPSSKVLCILKR